MNAENFYKREFFDNLSERLKKFEDSQKCIQHDVNSIKLKVNYMYGFAAGIAFIFSVAINWVISMIKGQSTT